MMDILWLLIWCAALAGLCVCATVVMEEEINHEREK